MKTSLLALLVVSQTASVLGGACQRMKFTFNLKPKFVPGTQLVCGDLESDVIESFIQEKAIAQMENFGYENVHAAQIKKGSSCPQHECTIQPGDACVPYCLDITFCVSDELEASTGTKILSINHVGKMQQALIDEMRKELPECLGIQNKFMADMYFEKI